MNNKIKYLSFLPVLLLASCNFEFKYYLPAGVVPYTGSSTWEGGDDDFDDSGIYDITIWTTEKISSHTEVLVKNFELASGGKYKITLTAQKIDEGNAAKTMLNDVSTGADLFVFAQDQLSRLKTANALSPIDSGLATHLKTVHSADSIQAATLGEKMYAFPMTSDNGYFLYYNDSYLNANDVKDMDTMIAKLGSQGKKLNFSKSDGFYAASYFLATGCYSHWTTDERTGRFISYDDNYNTELGLKAAKAYRSFGNKKAVAERTQWTNSAGAVITGVWEYEYLKTQWGAHLQCAELPYFTVDGQPYHMSSFDGYKLLGVKPQVDKKKASVCRKLAEYLTNAESQLSRFREVSWGPTAVAASQDPEVQAHPALAALKAQHEWAHQQETCPGSWFSSIGTLASNIKSDSTEAQLRSLLKSYEDGLSLLLDD